MPERFEYAPGVWINYEVRGEGQKTAVLLHGFGASLEGWRDIEEYLEPHLRLYLVDLLGFGLSAKPEQGRYGIEDQASIMADFIQRLGLNGVCLMGHSFGGAVAAMTYFKLAERGAADRIHSLILMGSPAAPQRLPFFILWLRNPLVSRMLGMLPASFSARYILRRITYDPTRVTDKQVERYARFQKGPESLRALAAAARQILPAKPDFITGRLATIRVPVLIVWGEHDNVVFRWQADLFKTLIPDAKLVIFPHCGHLPAEECPEATAEQILGFVENVKESS